jgi:predicted dehydrogenase
MPARLMQPRHPGQVTDSAARATPIGRSWPHGSNERCLQRRLEDMDFGVIGYGYWGPNIVRNLANLDGSQVKAIAEINPAAQARARKAYPGVRITASAMEVISATDVDVVAIVSPVWTHYELTKAALENGKHVFVEKPFTSTAAQGEELIELAQQKNLKIMVDHTFLFTGAVRRIGQLIDEGALGNLYYYDSTRVNLGLFQHDVNVLWDLAPHDLSIMDHLIKASPEAVVATGQGHLNGHEDVAFMTLYFPDKIIAHINVNWLSPVKVRTTLIGGEKRMIVWNDLEADEKVKVYDKGVKITSREGVYELLVSYRSGDMWSPQLEQVEALRQELNYFVDCISAGKEPFNNGCAGLRVVRMLEAASESLNKKGAFVRL